MAHTPLCTCVNPFCGEDHAPFVPATDLVAPDDLLDWEGPMHPEYSEYDAEAYDEMVAQDMAGLR